LALTRNEIARLLAALTIRPARDTAPLHAMVPLAAPPPVPLTSLPLPATSRTTMTITIYGWSITRAPPPSARGTLRRARRPGLILVTSVMISSPSPRSVTS